MSDDLRVAVLGVGMMGAFHVDALSKRVRGAKVTVVNDFLADKAAEVADAVGARVEADPMAAINDPDVDAVLIASPGAAHAEQLSACLDRGIPVLCEKPLTTDISSAYAIVQKETGARQATHSGRLHAAIRLRVRRAAEAHCRRRTGQPIDGALHSSQPSGR